MTRISGPFRLALASKGLLLLSLGLGFVGLAVAGVTGSERTMLVRVLSAGFVLPAVFLGWTAWLAFADAVEGHAVEIEGAVALTRARRASRCACPMATTRSSCSSTRGSRWWLTAATG